MISNRLSMSRRGVCFCRAGISSKQVQIILQDLKQEVDRQSQSSEPGAQLRATYSHYCMPPFRSCSLYCMPSFPSLSVTSFSTSAFPHPHLLTSNACMNAQQGQQYFCYVMLSELWRCWCRQDSCCQTVIRAQRQSSAAAA